MADQTKLFMQGFSSRTIMASDTESKPELPSSKDRRKIDVQKELDSEEPIKKNIHTGVNGKDPKATRTNTEGKRTENGDDKQAGLEPLGSVFAASDMEDAPELDKAGEVQASNKSQDETAKSPSSNAKDVSPRQTKNDNPSDTEGDYFTARADPQRHGNEVPEVDGKNLENDFEEVGVSAELSAADSKANDEAPAILRHAGGTSHSSAGVIDRPGVTKSIPARLHEQILRKQSMSSELNWAEDQADAGVSSSQRLHSKPSSTVTIPDSQAPFTEENLHSVSSCTNITPCNTEPERGPSDARPMSPPPVVAPTFPEASAPASAVEPEEYRGLVYYDGVDSMGRPVVIVNADALPRSASRKAAVRYLLQRLEPIVTQGPYVAIFLNTGEKSKRNRLPAGWLAACYRQMSYPFKKNVKHVVLVRPSFALNLMLGLMYPLISKKAHVKIKKVENLSALEAATNSEVALQHLGARFNTIAANSIIAGEGPTYGQGAAYQMPNL